MANLQAAIFSLTSCSTSDSVKEGIGVLVGRRSHCVGVGRGVEVALLVGWEVAVGRGVAVTMTTLGVGMGAGVYVGLGVPVGSGALVGEGV